LCLTPRSTADRGLCGLAATAAAAIASKESNTGGPETSATAPRSDLLMDRVASWTCGVTSTMTALRTRSGRLAVSRIAVTPPSDMPTTAAALGAASSSTGATASALRHGP
jgi:hypothetical protein